MGRVPAVWGIITPVALVCAFLPFDALLHFADWLTGWLMDFLEWCDSLPLAWWQQPVPPRRLEMHGELLQVLGDTLLLENAMRRHSDETSKQLTTSAAIKEEFLAVLSHELRTPLTPILGWTSILKRHADAKVVHAAGVLLEALTHAG